MRILGIDPGSRHTGWAVVSSGGGSLELESSGRLSPPTGESMTSRLATLSLELEVLVGRWQPEAVAVESTFHGVNSRSLIVLAQARGAILALLGRLGLEVSEYTPAEIKTAVAGNGRAGKDQVSRMVSLLLRLDPPPRASDQTDAMAVAVCFARRYRMDRLEALHEHRKAL